jgi:hypothetical protein
VVTRQVDVVINLGDISLLSVGLSRLDWMGPPATTAQGALLPLLLSPDLRCFVLLYPLILLVVNAGELQAGKIAASSRCSQAKIFAA